LALAAVFGKTGAKDCKSKAKAFLQLLKSADPLVAEVAAASFGCLSPEMRAHYSRGFAAAVVHHATKQDTAKAKITKDRWGSPAKADVATSCRAFNSTSGTDATTTSGTTAANTRATTDGDGLEGGLAQGSDDPLLTAGATWQWKSTSFVNEGGWTPYSDGESTLLELAFRCSLTKVCSNCSVVSCWNPPGFGEPSCSSTGRLDLSHKRRSVNFSAWWDDMFASRFSCPHKLLQANTILRVWLCFLCELGRGVMLVCVAQFELATDDMDDAGGVSTDTSGLDPADANADDATEITTGATSAAKDSQSSAHSPISTSGGSRDRGCSSADFSTGTDNQRGGTSAGDNSSFPDSDGSGSGSGSGGVSASNSPTRRPGFIATE
jgi:hypothetical protein